MSSADIDLQPSNQSKYPVATAEVLGTIAFKAGLPCKPALDKELLPLFEGLEVGEAEPILDAWTRNWKLAQEAAENETSLGSQLQDHRYKFRLEQANLIEAHGSEEQRIAAAITIIRELARESAFSKVTPEQQVHLLDRFETLVPPDKLQGKPPFGLGASCSLLRSHDTDH